MKAKIANSITSSFFDHLAISMAALCAVHCLVTPILLIALPIIATTFWVDANFHLWMLFLVVPCALLAIGTGYFRHKDKIAVCFAVAGIAVLVTTVILEQGWFTAGEPVEVAAAGTAEAAHASCAGCCAIPPPRGEGDSVDLAGYALSGFTGHAMLNTLGGLLLVIGHSRNFILCRRTGCTHVGRP